MTVRFAQWGAVLAGLGVALGAFGAHLLRSRVAPEQADIFETAVRYQMFHALALFAVGFARQSAERCRLATIAGWCFIAGVVLFSGSLYALVLTGTRTWGAVTPLGGLAFLAGWIALAMAFGRATLPQNHR